MKDRAASAPRPSIDVGCELAAMNARIDRLTALIEQRLPASSPSPERDWVTVAEAANLVGRTPAAIRARCRTRGIGVKADGGAWRIDRVRLLASRIG
jgi:hypothetical protein